jgi:hypothetical protein
MGRLDGSSGVSEQEHVGDGHFGVVGKEGGSKRIA